MPVLRPSTNSSQRRFSAGTSGDRSPAGHRGAGSRRLSGRTAIPGLPVAWFGLNPVVELRAFYDLPGRAESLNRAYGIQRKTELVRDVCPRVNPVDLAPDLGWLPLRTWQGRDDQVTPPHDLERLDATVLAAGGSHSIVYGPGGHATADGPRSQFDATAQIAFVRAAEAVTT